MIYITDTKFDTGEAPGKLKLGHTIAEVKVFGRGMLEIRLFFLEINIRNNLVTNRMLYQESQPLRRTFYFRKFE